MGERIVCHPNHEWTVYDRSSHRWMTVETKSLVGRKRRSGTTGGPRFGPEGKRGGRWVFQLPDVEALQFPEADLPLDPYVLGAWLGDGTTGRSLIAHAQSDREVVDEIEARGFVVSGRHVQANTGVAYARFGSGRPNVRSPMTAALYAVGVLFEKHIPERYLRSSMEQRLQLLAGLIDTDGHFELKTGRVRFVTTSERLRDGAVDLATTLGFRPNVISAGPTLSSSGVQGRKFVYQVGFQPTMPIPTRIPRKHCAVKAVRRRVSIVAVEPCASEPGRCIQVDRADGLYLVGRSLIPTHNSELASKKLPGVRHRAQPDETDHLGLGRQPARRPPRPLRP